MQKDNGVSHKEASTRMAKAKARVAEHQRSKGKGSWSRVADHEAYGSNWDRIFGKK